MVFFSVEYFLRLWSCSVDEKHAGWRGRLSWMIQPMQIVDAIALLAFYVDLLTDIEHDRLAGTISFKLLRLLRLLSLLKVERQVHAFVVLKSVLSSKVSQLLVCAYAGMVLVALFGSCMFYLEANRDDGTLHSIPDALYWAIGTITTVGFGGKPGTPLGKVLSAGVSLVGVLFLAVPSGIVGSGFAEMMDQDRKTRRVASAFMLRKEAREARGGASNGTAGGQGESPRGSWAGDDDDGSVGGTPLSSPMNVGRLARGGASGGGGGEWASVAEVDAAWAQRIEERQAALEASLGRVEAMLGVISSKLVGSGQPGGASQQQRAVAGGAGGLVGPVAVDASVEAPA